MLTSKVSSPITSVFNEIIENLKFRWKIKFCRYLSSLHQRNSAQNYRSVSILPTFSKVFERCLYDQRHDFTNPFHATGLFLYPLKTWRKLEVFWCFQRYRKRPVAWNGLIIYCQTIKPGYKKDTAFIIHWL